MTLLPPTRQEWEAEERAPAMHAYAVVKKTMDTYDILYNSKWVTQKPIDHAKHALDHCLNIQNFLISQPDGYYAQSYDLKEEIEHAITRLGMLYAQITKEPSEEGPLLAGALDVTHPLPLESV